MMKLLISFISLVWAFLFGFGLATPPVSANELVSPAPDDAQVYIISPTEGDTLPETFKVKFGLSGMGIAPAGIDKFTFRTSKCSTKRLRIFLEFAIANTLK